MIGRLALATLAVFLLINQSVEGYAVVPERPIPLPPRRNITLCWDCNKIPEEETLEEIRVHFDKVLEWCQWNGDRCQQMASLLCSAVHCTTE